MSKYVVTLQSDVSLPPTLDAAWLCQVARATLRHQEQPPHAEITLVVTDDATIAELNSQFRHVSGPTDVLAFATNEGQPFVLPESASIHLGDIVISLETAERQASEHKQPIAQELALLIVHGCLHLLGYDHATPKEKAEMWSVQEQILQQIPGGPFAT